MKKLYGNLKMTWLAVIIFAIITGIYTGLIMLVPALDDTSFQDIGVFVEWWVIFAVILVVNCSKGWEAGLKCFVFFLISQPLVYLTEIVFGNLSWDLARSYYFNIWGPLSLLTLPGGWIAYYCKKQNTLGAVILGLGNTIQAITGANYFARAVTNFPRHLLSAVVCFGSIILMSLYIQKGKRNRFISLVIPVVLTLISLISLKYTGRHLI